VKANAEPSVPFIMNIGRAATGILNANTPSPRSSVIKI